jgi:hypothetical protein
MLFHYHFWTPYLEETEKFYKDNGFRVSQRLGKYEGDFQTFNPPLSWNDFRDKNILFRIIETRKGAVNITFGYGKKIMFDHIGFFVSLGEHNKICENAITKKWLVNKGEKRTFITTPYGFRIELQINADVMDAATDIAEIKELTIVTKVRGLENDLSILFGKPVINLSSVAGEKVTIKQGIIKGMLSTDMVDPNGVRILNCV